MAEKIKIPGELESVAADRKVADVLNIKDGANGNKSQSQINAETVEALSNRYLKSETYNRREVEQMVTPPNPVYKIYDTYAELLEETEHPAGAIYRVAGYNDVQADVTSYAEYTWNGNGYKLLSVKSQVDEIYDISASNNTQYKDLSAAIGVNGANIPMGVRRSAMSVKYQGLDGNYAQYRYLLKYTNTAEGNQAFANTANWTNVGETQEVTISSSTANIKPNILYKLGVCDSLEVTLIAGAEGILNEYMFEFTVSGDSFTLTLPSGIVWYEEPEFISGFKYQVSIVNNLAITAGWEVEDEQV